jgi:hypothetical protein
MRRTNVAADSGGRLVKTRRLPLAAELGVRFSCMGNIKKNSEKYLQRMMKIKTLKIGRKI